MKTDLTILTLALLCATACNKPAAPASTGNAGDKMAAPSSPAPPTPDAVQQKLAEFSGSDATNCGRLDARAGQDPMKAASECAIQASQGKKPFYVVYDMPGMSVGVAGTADGKLFTVQNQGGALSSGSCPSQLRVASSGRVTCFSPGDMTSMSESHSAGAMTPGKAKPHASGTSNPHVAQKQQQ